MYYSMYYSTGYPCFPSIVNTNKLKRSRVVVNEIFVSFNSSNTADWPTQDDLFPPFIHTKLVIWGTPKLPPFSIFHGNPICTFLGSFFPSSLTHFWGYCHFWSKDRKINFVETGWGRGKSIHAAQCVCSDFCSSPPCDDVKCRKCGKKASKYERYVSPTGNGTSEIDSLLLEQRHI